MHNLQTTASDITTINLREHQGPSYKTLDVIVDVGDPWLQLAVKALLEKNGFRVVETDSGDAFTVTDSEAVLGDRVMRLIDDQSGASQAALASLLEGQIGALVSKGDPGHLAVALNALSIGMVSIPRSLLDLANSVPELGKRQRKIAIMIANGLSNSEIAKQLDLTEATVKRELGFLIRKFKASSRVDLAMRCAKIGYQE